MTFSEAARSGMRHFKDFDGRTSRSGYFWWQLFSFLVLFCLFFLANLLVGIGGALPSLLAYVVQFAGFAWYVTMTVLAGWAVLVRRLHDVDRSGWTSLWAFTGVGALYLLYLAVQPGISGSNKYGDGPRSD